MGSLAQFHKDRKWACARREEAPAPARNIGAGGPYDDARLHLRGTLWLLQTEMHDLNRKGREKMGKRPVMDERGQEQTWDVPTDQVDGSEGRRGRSSAKRAAPWDGNGP